MIFLMAVVVFPLSFLQTSVILYPLFVGFFSLLRVPYDPLNAPK